MGEIDIIEINKNPLDSLINETVEPVIENDIYSSTKFNIPVTVSNENEAINSYFNSKLLEEEVKPLINNSKLLPEKIIDDDNVSIVSDISLIKEIHISSNQDKKKRLTFF